MWTEIPPGLILIVGSLLLAFLRGPALKAGLLALPLLSMAQVFSLPMDTVLQVDVMGITLTPVRVDRLSMVWGGVFSLAAVLASIYALHVKDRVQHIAALAYAGAGVMSVFAGDLITLFVGWELTAITSVFLIWARREADEYAVGMRYLLWQIASGVILLSAILFHVSAGGGLAFGTLVGQTTGFAQALFLIAFGIKAGFPLLNSWLIEGYPAATPTGTVFLSSFTTKLAIYALARSFAGYEPLVLIGAIMVVLPILLAVYARDMRAVLTYALNQQLGFMVVAIGVGTEMAINGVAAHAVAHILYKSLLFMAMGSVLTQVGSVREGEIGGLLRKMPVTAAMTLVGAAAMGAPLFCGFISKSVILSAVASEGMVMTWLILMFGSAAVFFVVGARLPYVVFFGEDKGIEAQEGPLNMRVAMGLTALAAVAVGVMPEMVYSRLPYPLDYHPYTVDHVVTMVQTLLGVAFAFVLALRMGMFAVKPAPVMVTSDWLYRQVAPRMWDRVQLAASMLVASVRDLAFTTAGRVVDWAARQGSPSGRLGSTTSTGQAVFSISVIFLLLMLLFFNLGDEFVTVGHAGDHGAESHEVQDDHGQEGDEASHHDVDDHGHPVHNGPHPNEPGSLVYSPMDKALHHPGEPAGPYDPADHGGHGGGHEGDHGDHGKAHDAHEGDQEVHDGDHGAHEEGHDAHEGDHGAHGEAEEEAPAPLGDSPPEGNGH